MVPEGWNKNKWKNRVKNYFEKFDSSKPFEEEFPDYVPNFILSKEKKIKKNDSGDLERKIWECRNTFLTGGIITMMGFSGIGLTFYEATKQNSNFYSLMLLSGGSLVLTILGGYLTKKNFYEYRIYKKILKYRE